MTDQPSFIARFIASDLFGKLMRFAVVGAGTGLVYAAVTLGAIHSLGVSAVWASVIGYLAVLPLSFSGHRQVTFRSEGRWTGEFFRFCFSFFLGMAASIASMHFATVTLSQPPFVGVALAILLVPVISFIIMNLWVFTTRSTRKH